MGGSRKPQEIALAADAELRVISIDKLAESTCITAAEIFEPLKLHLQLADLLEQFRLLSLALGLSFYLLSTGKQLAGSLQELFLPLAHLDRSHREVRYTSRSMP